MGCTCLAEVTYEVCATQQRTVFPHDAERGFDTTGQQVFFEITPPSSSVSFVSVAVGDVNNDGRQDVAAVTHEHTDGPMRVWILRFGVGVTDFDCIGCPDVVGAQRDGLVVFRGRGCATAP
ncbi:MULTISPECIES: FG-GAP repeat protein [Sorangium]|uniref:FG-GAP repeat protein n=1 Tax=Sorangium TaxID=39643 RepID=UPI0013EBD51D|nr:MULTISPECIES: FG-GAP repeat protein [Sorangium]